MEVIAGVNEEQGLCVEIVGDENSLGRKQRYCNVLNPNGPTDTCLQTTNAKQYTG